MKDKNDGDYKFPLFDVKFSSMTTIIMWNRNLYSLFRKDFANFSETM